MAKKKVRMIAQISGTRDGKDWPQPGETIYLPADEADNLIRIGAAAEPDAPAENALADLSGVETADLSSKAGQKAVRVQAKPAPHADEPDAYHSPALPGEKAAAKAGQKAVDKANDDLVGEAAVDNTRKRAADK